MACQRLAGNCCCGFDLRGHRIQGRADVAHHFHVRQVVLVHLRRCAVDVDDLAVLVRVPAVRVILDHVVADADDHVGPIEAARDDVAGLQSDRAEPERMRERHHALGHERIDHRDVQPLGEADQVVRGAGANHAVAGQDQRVGRGGKNLRRLADRLGLGQRPHGMLHHQRRFPVDFHLRDVFRKVDEAHARLLGLGLLERLADHLGDGLGLEDLDAVLRDRPEEVDQVEVLVALLVQPGCGRLPGDGNHGGVIHVGVGHAGHQIGRPGPQRRQTDPRPAGQPAVHVGHEGCPLFVPGRDEADRAVEQDIENLDVLFAGQSKNGLHPLVFQTTNEQFGRLHRREHLSQVVLLDWPARSAG